MEDGEWIMVNGEFLTRITQILQMAPTGDIRESVLFGGDEGEFIGDFRLTIYNFRFQSFRAPSKRESRRF